MSPEVAALLPDNLATDQEIANFLLDRDINTITFKLVDSVEIALLTYSDSKEEYDAKLASAV